MNDITDKTQPLNEVSNLFVEMNGGNLFVIERAPFKLEVYVHPSVSSSWLWKLHDDKYGCIVSVSEEIVDLTFEEAKAEVVQEAFLIAAMYKDEAEDRVRVKKWNAENYKYQELGSVRRRRMRKR